MYLKGEPEISTLFAEDPVYSATLQASTQYRIATGIRQGQWVRFRQGQILEVSSSGPLCLQLDGFSLHAAVAIAKHRRDSLEKLTRYSGVLAPHSRYRSRIIPGKTRAQIKQEQVENEVPILHRRNSKTKSV